MNWTEAFEEARKAGGALERRLDPEAWARALRELERAMPGLERGDARHQEACMSGLLAWWDELGTCVRIVRAGGFWDRTRAMGGDPADQVPPPMPGNPTSQEPVVLVEAGTLAGVRVEEERLQRAADMLSESAPTVEMSSETLKVLREESAAHGGWVASKELPGEVVLPPSVDPHPVVTTAPGYSGTIKLDPDPTLPEPVDLGPAPVTLKPERQPQPKKKGKR